MRRCLFKIVLLLLLIVFFPYLLKAQDAEEEETAQTAAQKKEDAENWAVFEAPELTIEAEAPRQDRNPVLPERSDIGTRKNIVSREQIQEQGSEDFSDTLRNVPGVIVGQRNLAGTTTGSSVFVRGWGCSHPSTEVTTSFDDVPRYGLIYGQSMADGIPVSAAESVEVRKSPQPSEFGAGYALINVEPRSMDEEGRTAESGFSGGSYFTFLQNAAFGIKKGRFDIFAAQSWMSTNGHVVHSGAHQQSYYLNTGLSINANWNIRLLGNYVEAQTEQPPYTGQSRDDILSAYQTNSVFSTATLNNKYDNAEGFLKLYYNNTQFKWLDEEARIPGDWSLQSLQAFGAKAKEEFTILEKGKITSGMDIDWMLVVNEDHNTTRPTVITTFPAMIMFTPYAGASWLFGDKEGWHITPSAGIRGYIHSVWANQISFQAGLAPGWKALDFNFNYSRGLVYPAPAVIQSLLGNSSVYRTIDLKSVEPEKVDHFEAGISYAPKPGKLFSYALDGSYFYDDGKNRIIVNSQIPGNASSVSSFKLQGLELAASLKFSPKKLFADTVEAFAGGTLYTDLAATDENGNTAKKMPFTPVFSLSAGLRWAFLTNFHLSADFQYLHDLYSGGLGISPSFSEPTEANKLNDICLLNLRLGFTYKKEKWRVAVSELFVSVNNVFDHQYEYYTGFVMPGITWMIGGSIKFK